MSKVSLIKLDWFRLTLAVYFLVYAYITAVSLIPLPDEPPRINFWGVFVVVGGIVIAYHCLTSSFRLFQIGTWFFLWIAWWQMGKKLKFLEMMLEAKTIEQVAQFTLPVIMLVLMSPKAFRIFNKRATEYQRAPSLTTKEGIPF